VRARVSGPSVGLLVAVGMRFELRPCSYDLSKIPLAFKDNVLVNAEGDRLEKVLGEFT
jgi:hypothetical protein